MESEDHTKLSSCRDGSLWRLTHDKLCRATEHNCVKTHEHEEK